MAQIIFLKMARSYLDVLNFPLRYKTVRHSAEKLADVAAYVQSTGRDRNVLCESTAYNSWGGAN